MACCRIHLNSFCAERRSLQTGSNDTNALLIARARRKSFGLMRGIDACLSPFEEVWSEQKRFLPEASLRRLDPAALPAISAFTCLQQPPPTSLVACRSCEDKTLAAPTFALQISPQFFFIRFIHSSDIQHYHPRSPSPTYLPSATLELSAHHEAHLQGPQAAEIYHRRRAHRDHRSG